MYSQPKNKIQSEYKSIKTIAQSSSLIPEGFDKKEKDTVSVKQKVITFRAKLIVD